MRTDKNRNKNKSTDNDQFNKSVTLRTTTPNKDTKKSTTNEG